MIFKRFGGTLWASMKPGTLYIVATPIGNLGDITLRALEVLKAVDLVLCEDTRETRKVLEYFQLTKSVMSYHQHSSEVVEQDIIEKLKEGKNIALVTDAGTPGISDPGNKLVSAVSRVGEHLSIVPIPGPSALTAALSVSGFPTEKFLFLGFPPHKNKRKKFFEEVAATPYTVAFYESSHRIKKAIDEIQQIVDENREICICRELTKKFEQIYRGKVRDLKTMVISEKGEFVVIIR